MGLEVVAQNGDLLLDIPVEVGRLDITGTTSDGATRSVSYQFGQGQDQVTSVQVVVAMADLQPDRLKEIVVQPVAWEEYNVDQLQALLRENDMEVGGNKDELIERIEEAKLRPHGVGVRR